MRTGLGRAGHRTGRWLAGVMWLALLVPASGWAQAQTGTVTGRVTEGRLGGGVPGAAVEVEGTNLTVLTDDEGRYRIGEVPAGRRTLVVRHIGYTLDRQVVTVAAGQTHAVDFELTTAPIALDEVIVTGAAGGARLRTLGHSVATIQATDALEKSQAPELTSLLLARAPGLRIDQRTGRLGAVPEIEIRGSSGALIYIDGVRVNSADGLGAAGGGLGQQGSSVGGRLNDIDPEDIASIEIIKGPAAATIYGTQAMDGVVQIITKKGALGQAPRFNLRTSYGTIFFRDAEGRMPTNYMRDGDGNIVAWNGVEQERERGVPLFTNGHSAGVHGSVSGGTEQFRYYASVSREDQEGVEPNNYGSQFGLHTNLDFALSPKVNLSTNLNFTELDQHLGTDSGLSAMLGAMVGHILAQPNSRGFALGYPPEISWELYDNMAKVSRFTASGAVNYAMTDWLRHRVLVGVDYTSGDHRTLERFATEELAQYLSPTQAAGRIGQTLRLNRNLTLDYSGSLNTALTSSLASSFAVGLQALRTESTTSNLGGQGFPAPGIESISSTATKLNTTQTDVLNTTVGMYVQEKLGWNDRLFVSAAVRIDNNSAFGEDFRWVTYPKADVAWVVSEEPFWRWGNVVNTLRLRAAYGESGQAPQTFQALRTFVPVQGPGGTNAVTPGAQGNSNLRPERGKEFEIGFEAALFDRLSLDFTYFNKKHSDLIEEQEVAPSSGFPGEIPVNLGRVDFSGFELQAGVDALRRSNFNWRIDANVFADQSWVIELGDFTGSGSDPGEGLRADHPRGAVFVKRVVSADLDPTTQRAINVLCDGGPDNDHAPMACAQAPTIHIGQNRPKYSGAVMNTLTLFDRLRLFVLVDFKSSHLQQNTDEILRCTGAVGVRLCDISVHPENYSPVEVAQTVPSSQGLLEMYWQDAGFIKLREISATYTLPPQWVRLASGASITLAGRELGTWTSFRGLDPENAGQAILPPLSRFSATLNLEF